MDLVLIAAMDKNGVIGSNGTIPWYIPEDLKHFKELTKNHPVLMGRTTFDSIYQQLKKPLPNRTNIVLSKNKEREFPPEVVLCSALGESISIAQEDARKRGVNEVYVIGGQKIYEQTIGLASRLELTIVDGEFKGDTYFPSISHNEWVTSREERHANYCFKTINRR